MKDFFQKYSDKITFLHIEPTTRCNAWCPGCTRSNNGFGLRKDLVIQDLSLEKLSKILSYFPNISFVQLCGNDGDPCSAKNINEQIELIKEYKKDIFIQIHTNGSIRNEKWWSDLAINNENKNLQVFFGIDGLQDTHSIYRQATSFKKVISNATSFIKNGGSAVWQFLVFEHNKHQILEAYNLSQKIGFKRFFLVKNTSVSGDELHYKTGKPLNLRLPDMPYFIENTNDNRKTIFEENCIHLSKPSVYVSASGSMFPCCHLARSYENFDIESENEFKIHQEFASKNFRPKCLRTCGSE